MSASSEVRVVFLGNSASAVRAVNTLGGSLSTLNRTASLATRALGVGLLGGLVGATKAAIDYDKSLRQVNSIAKLSEKQLGALSKQILALSKVSGRAPRDLADGLYDVVSSGFDATSALKILSVTSKAATAGLTSTEVATKAVVSVLNAYGKGAKDAGRTADILFSTVEKGVLTFEELASQIGDVLPVAAQLGVPLESVGGALATITLNGVSAAEAATQLKQLMISILKPSEDLGAAIKRMGFETGETALKTLGLEGFMRKLTDSSKGSAKAFTDWFPNVRAMNGALGIAGQNIKQLHDNIAAMSRRGAALAAFNEQSKSIAVQWQKAKASLVAAAIPVGQLLFPALRRGAEAVGDFAMRVQASMPQIRAQFADLANAAQSLGGALADIGRSQQGQTALAGLLSGVLGAKAAGGVQNLIASIRGLNPAVAIATGAFGLLGASIYQSLTASTALERRLASMVGSALQLRGALDAQAQAHLLARQAATQLEVATFNLEAAQEAAAKAARTYGAGSREHKQALLDVRVASDQLAQAKLTLKRANEQAAKSDEKAAATTRANSKELRLAQRDAQNAANDYERVRKEIVGVGLGATETNPHIKEMLRQMASDAVQAYANAHAVATRAMGGTKKQAELAKQAVFILNQELGRLPTRKEIDIFIRQHGSADVRGLRGQGTGPGGNRGQGGPARRFAVGGFVPGAPGTRTPTLTIFSPEVVTA